MSAREIIITLLLCPYFTIEPEMPHAQGCFPSLPHLCLGHQHCVPNVHGVVNIYSVYLNLKSTPIKIHRHQAPSMYFLPLASNAYTALFLPLSRAVLETLFYAVRECSQKYSKGCCWVPLSGKAGSRKHSVSASTPLPNLAPRDLWIFPKSKWLWKIDIFNWFRTLRQPG